MSNKYTSKYEETVINYALEIFDSSPFLEDLNTVFGKDTDDYFHLKRKYKNRLTDEQEKQLEKLQNEWG